MIKTRVEQRWKSPDVADHYDSERFESLVGRLYHRLQCRALRRCLRHVPGGSRIVDVPCGTGRMLPLLLCYASSVIGMDVSEPMMRHARRRLNGQGRVCFVRGDAKAMPLADRSVDAVFCIRFAMHLKPAERSAVLQEFARVSRNHVVVEFGCDSRWHRVRRFLRSLFFKVLRPRHTYPKSVSKQDIVAGSRGAGLEVCGWQWTQRLASESVFVHMRKQEVPARSVGD